MSPGDTVGIVAPARKIDQAILSRAIEILQSWGLQVVIGKNVFHGDHSYLSSTDVNRKHDLQSMLEDSTIAAIICARGGYGSTRIIDNLRLERFAENPKWLVGFSDITSIHLLLLKAGFQSIHGTMPVLFSKVDSVSSVESLRKLLFDGLTVLHAPVSSFNRFGSSSAFVVGGNLSLIVDSLATSTEIDTEGKILVIEEVDEYYYKVDRMMTQLKRAGKLDDLAGMVVGHMTDIKNGELHFSEQIEEVILDSVSKFGYPVAFRFPIGHENPNFAWIQGGTARLQVDEFGASLSFVRTGI